MNEDTLEDVLLFVGILSGRGYRHRRLAVREAWANQCQKPGVSVCRFMLSEDEVTPQASFRPLTCTHYGREHDLKEYFMVACHVLARPLKKALLYPWGPGICSMP